MLAVSLEVPLGSMFTGQLELQGDLSYTVYRSPWLGYQHLHAVELAIIKITWEMVLLSALGVSP